ncbi:hypothetical protein ABIC08_008956 [Bradyrhizobium sp. RT9b]|uniref:hypothetical protein n=1 Tax=Bradyrhizobium sp. RT9b TaxID=3156385 RepID=UPI00339A8832
MSKRHAACFIRGAITDASSKALGCGSGKRRGVFDAIWNSFLGSDNDYARRKRCSQFGGP